jgi:hypothetical protein
VYDHKDIILAVDYHAKNIEVRWLNCATGQERCLNIPTTRSGILRLVEKAIAEAAQLAARSSGSWNPPQAGRESKN